MKSKNKLPPNCYRDRSRIAFKPYLGRENGKRIYGRPIKLGNLDTPLSAIWRAYEDLTCKTPDTLQWLLHEYNSSPQFQQLAKSTQTGYLGYAEVICRKPTKAGSTFGESKLSTISRRTIRKYLDSNDHPVTANRHIQYLKAAWNWATQRYAHVPENNPCLGVTLNPEKARDRYITDDEYHLVRDAALTMRVPYFAYAMELAYLCRARRSEVFGLTYDDILEEGLLIRRGKGSRSEVTLWNPRLKAAVEGCKSIYPSAPTPIKGKLLLHDKMGVSFSKNALDSAWQRVIAKAMAADKEIRLEKSFTFHDLKAKGATDSSQENAALHKSKKMEAVYDRLPKQVTIDYG